MRACEADLREAAKALAKDFPVCAKVCDQSADYVRKLEQKLAELRGIGKRLLAEHKNSNVDWQAFRELEQALQGGDKDG